MYPDPDQPDAPKLADALRAAYTHRTAVPPSIDASILSSAHQAFEARRRHRMTIRWGTGLATSLAAAIALAVILHHPTRTATTPTQVATSTIKGDLNADGRVDMTDALLLAQHLAAHNTPNPTWDTNGDGTVDGKDIDTLAATAVSLKQPAAFLPRPVPRERAGVKASLAHQTAPARLPAFDDLGLVRLPVGLASASGMSRTTANVSLAKASPTRYPNPEAPR